MKILVDTNVILSGLIAKGACFEIFEDLVYSHTPVITSFIRAETQRSLLQKFSFSPATAKELLSVIDNHFVKGKDAIKLQHVCRDPEDDQVLADALFNEVDIILSGDKDLLSMEKYDKIRIIGPKDYWKL